MRESIPQTLFDKLWRAHVVHEEAHAPTLLYIDLHLIHEVTSPQAFDGLRRRGLKVRHPERTVATVDHSIPTQHGPIQDALAATQIATLERNARSLALRCTEPITRNGVSFM